MFKRGLPTDSFARYSSLVSTVKLNFVSVYLLLLMIYSSFFIPHPVLAQSSGVAQVIFAVGEVHRETSSGQRLAIQKGDRLEVGDRLNTGASGHIHLRFIDDAFVSVRPHSQMHIEQYVYDAKEPERNRVKFVLTQGTGRWITGKAGQANKQQFRVNTPVAAIGIRGTDFVVQTGIDVTRIAVQQGGITAAPLGGECSAQSFGPCAGAYARELAGSLSGNFLEVKQQVSPKLVTPTEGRSPFVFPRPEEPKVSTEANKVVSVSPQNQLVLGRWSHGAVTPDGMELLGQNDAFVLYRTQSQLSYASGSFGSQGSSGSVAFSIADVEGYARASNGRMYQANITHPSLLVNFNTMQYVTKFGWEYAGQQLELSNAGKVSDTGRFVQNRDRSNFALSGGLTGNADGAGYLFIKRLPGDDAYGVLVWKR